MLSKLKCSGSGGDRMVTTPHLIVTELDSRNPLLIPEMLENILEFLPVKDLKSCRLVNKFWKQTALKPMKKKSRFLLTRHQGLERSMEKFLQCFGVDPGSGLLSELHDDIPSTRFEIFTSIINEQSSDRDKSILANYLQAISPVVTKITLHGGKDIGRLLNEMQLEELSFPSLKCIVFVDRCTRLLGVEAGTHPCLFSPWMSLFIQNSPQLEKLELSTHGGARDPSLTLFFQVLKDKQGLNIKDLIIYTTIENNDLISLSESGLQLKSLTLRICNFPQLSIGLVHQLLKTQTESLENLTIQNDIVGVHADVPFPIMKNLMSLSIQGGCPGMINYAEQMPFLERVIFAGTNHDWCLNGELKASPATKELCFRWTCPITVKIREAVRIFPNINKLETVENHCVSIVYDSLPKLEELTLLMLTTSRGRGRSIDELLTGLTEEGCQTATETLRNWTPDFDDSKIKIGINHSPISVLTKLKLLRLSCHWTLPSELEISKVSICLALMKMPSLRILDLCERIRAPDELIPSAVLNEFRKDRLILWKLNRIAAMQLQPAIVNY